MQFLRNMPLRRRLLLISLVTISAALLLASAVMFAAEYISFRRSIVRDLSVKADIIGSQSTAAMVFGDRKEAAEILASLRADRHIEFAVLYARDGTPFAEYRRQNVAGAAAPPPREYGHVFRLSTLTLFHPVVLRGSRIGALHLQSDLAELYDVIARYSIVVIIVMSVPLLAAMGLMGRLQRTITDPVADLVALMQRVVREQDFSTRAAARSRDEIGALAAGFNDMLAYLEQRDREIARHRSNLEDTVADLRRSTAELQAANKKLQALDSLKSDFISVVSHELRTPITSIKAFVELMLMKPGMQAERKARLLTIINIEIDRLARLISDLLDLSRIESGRMNWKVSDLSIEDILQTSLAGMLPLAANKGLIMTSELEPGLPRFPGDRDRLVQVMTNLISNAIKFTPAGGSVDVRAYQERSSRSRIIIEVRDTGIGIPAEEFPSIFEKFHRAGDVLTATTEGTGLGLAIAREIIEYHGGTIRAQSAYGTGSTFTVTLPFDAPWNAADRPSRSPGSANRTSA